ncbi:hypothetical protein [Streptomyces sp. NPDC054962]
MPHHALDITLTRAITPAELLRAARTTSLAANHDGTRLLAVVQAKTPGKAFHRLRRQVSGLIPIDVITTHYPDSSGQILLNVTFPPSAHTALASAAAHAAQPLHQYVHEAVSQAMTRHARAEADRLEAAMHNLLAGTAPAHLLTALGRALAHDLGDTP